MSFNELDSLMMQADIANQEARERGSMSKHTPGPWKAEFHGSVWHIEEGSGVQLSCVYVWTEDGGRKEAAANARLMAAAPEMLAVLRAVRGSVADSLMGGCQSFDDFHDSLSDALDAIDATIEDATKEEA